MNIFSDRFQIEKTLSQKAGRQTFLARDFHTQAQVVIKCLMFGNQPGWDDFKLFEREAETLKSLDHPSIPKYLDYFELDSANGKGFALVQSYIEASSLEQQLNAGRSFSEQEIRQCAEALLDILNYLHRRHPAVIHRDIKPSNILLGDRTGNHVGQVYLIDFGSVQNLAPQADRSITVVGTYGYMPPEQFGGRTTPASDLYSLGATLIYLTTGKHPADLPQHNFKLDFRPYTSLSEPLLIWLERLIEPSLDNRLPTASEALKELREGQRPNLLPFERSQLSLPLTSDRLFWNAVWRMSSVGATISILMALILPSTGYGLAIQGFVLVGSLVVGVTLGLGLANGLLLAWLTKQFFSRIKSARRYRLVMTGTATVFSACLMATLLGSIALTPDALILVGVIALTMGVAGHWFADWYVRASRALSSERSSQLKRW